MRRLGLSIEQRRRLAAQPATPEPRVIELIQADARHIPLADASVDCVVTSPPYWGLRDYGVEGQLGLESSVDCLGWAADVRCGACYVCSMVGVFEEVRRVLKPSGTCWINMGDCYANDAKGVRGTDKSTLTGNGAYQAEATPPRMQKSWRGTRGLKRKDLVGQPWRLALALQTAGWYLRNDIVWHKPSVLPESVNDRATRNHEYLFLLTKAPRYFFNQEAWSEPCSEGTHLRVSQDVAAQVGSDRANAGGKTNGPMKAVYRQPQGWQQGAGEHSPAAFNTPGVNPKAKRSIERAFSRKREPEPSHRQNESFSAAIFRATVKRNRRTVWTVPVQPTSEAHFATFPEALVEPCILAGCPADGVVLDPFCGSGTTLAVANRLGRSAIGLELNPEYIAIASRRIFADVTPTRVEASAGQKLLALEAPEPSPAFAAGDVFEDGVGRFWLYHVSRDGKDVRTKRGAGRTGNTNATAPAKKLASGKVHRTGIRVDPETGELLVPANFTEAGE
jgi:DNA modification methylase